MIYVKFIFLVLISAKCIFSLNHALLHKEDTTTVIFYNEEGDVVSEVDLKEKIEYRKVLRDSNGTLYTIKQDEDHPDKNSVMVIKPDSIEIAKFGFLSIYNIYAIGEKGLIYVHGYDDMAKRAIVIIDGDEVSEITTFGLKSIEGIHGPREDGAWYLHGYTYENYPAIIRFDENYRSEPIVLYKLHEINEIFGPTMNGVLYVFGLDRSPNHRGKTLFKIKDNVISKVNPGLIDEVFGLTYDGILYLRTRGFKIFSEYLTFIEEGKKDESIEFPPRKGYRRMTGFNKDGSIFIEEVGRTYKVEGKQIKNTNEENIKPNSKDPFIRLLDKYKDSDFDVENLTGLVENLPDLYESIKKTRYISKEGARAFYEYFFKNIFTILEKENFKSESKLSLYQYFISFIKNPFNSNNSPLYDLLLYLINFDNHPLRPYAAALMFDFILDQGNLYLKTEGMEEREILSQEEHKERMKNTKYANFLLKIIYFSNIDFLKEKYGNIYSCVKKALEENDV